MNTDALRRLVREEVLRSLGAAQPAPDAEVAPPAAAPTTPPVELPGLPDLREPSGLPELRELSGLPDATRSVGPLEGGVARWLRASRPAPPSPRAGPAPTRDDTPTGRVRNPANPALLRRVLAASPSRLGVGRAGTRYPTEVYLQLRADHAIARDAVDAECSEAMIEQLGCLPLRTLCEDRQDYLLHPDHGRRLDAASIQRLQQGGSRGADVQLIVGDGLSAWAAELNAPALLPALRRGLGEAGFSVGHPLFVRFARVGVQDHVGVLLNARATFILLGERPGLGTGDSLSIYFAYGPRLDQDNAEKNCISNVRAAGLQPVEATRLAVELMRRAVAAGRGGLAHP